MPPEPRVTAFAQAGFSLVLALFILVVLAILGAFLVSIAGVQRQSVNLALESTQAAYAARSGLEYGIAQAIDNGSCPASANPPLSGGPLQGFTVTVTCTQSSYSERGSTHQAYLLGATAVSGVYGQPDYVSRRSTAKIVN